jgi:outer membrane protein
MSCMSASAQTGSAVRRICVVVLAVGLALVAAGVAAGEEGLELTLEQAIELALEHSHELALARAGADGAEARARQARAGFFPRVAANGSYTRLDEAPYMDASSFGDLFAPLMAPFEYLVDEGYLDPATLEGLSGGGTDKIYLGDDDIYSVGVSVTQPLFTGGALMSAHGAARHAARAELLNVERTADQLRFDVTRAYVGLVQARAALDVMENMVAQMESHLSDVEAFYSEGMVLESEAMLARVRMSEVELGLSRAEHMARLADAALAFVLGIDVDTLIEPVDTLDRSGDQTGDLASLTSVALEFRPDLAAMQEVVGAAGNGISMARSGYFPSVVAMGSYNWDRPNREYEPEFYEHWSVTLALSMSVFDWGLTGNRVREARAALTQAERGRGMFENVVRLEVKQSYLSLDEALDALAIAEDGLSQAREGMRVAREAFRNGIAANSNVLDAQAALTTAEMNGVAGLSNLRIAEAQLELATGGASRPEGTE